MVGAFLLSQETQKEALQKCEMGGFTFLHCRPHVLLRGDVSKNSRWSVCDPSPIMINVWMGVRDWTWGELSVNLMYLETSRRGSLRQYSQTLQSSDTQDQVFSAAGMTWTYNVHAERHRRVWPLGTSTKERQMRRTGGNPWFSFILSRRTPLLHDRSTSDKNILLTGPFEVIYLMLLLSSNI